MKIFLIQKMIKKLLISSFYAVIVFCVLSYFSIMYSLLTSVGNPSLKPVTNIGVPFKYYYQFWLSGSDSPNCGWNIDNFVFDVLLIWMVVTIVYLIIKRKNEI
jgi:heme/copper-type cytochrome/quinol oxidase subunit 4